MGRPVQHVTCTRSGCGKPHLAKGLCRRHYAEHDVTCEMCGATFTTTRHGARVCDHPKTCRWFLRDLPRSTPLPWRKCARCDRWHARPKLSKKTSSLPRYCTRHDCHQHAEARRVSARGRGAPALRCGYCPRCGDSFIQTVGGPIGYCSSRCKKADHRDRRRARKRAAYVADVRRSAILERDDWTCQICGAAIDRTAVAPDPLAATIDHVIPLARGGTHEPANVQAAHFICNSRKSDQVEGGGDTSSLGTGGPPEVSIANP